MILFHLFLRFIRQTVVFKVSEEKIAQIRLKFWYDALDKIYEKNREKILPEHPVIRELHHVSLLVEVYLVPIQSKLTLQFIYRLSPGTN